MTVKITLSCCALITLAGCSLWDRENTNYTLTGINANDDPARQALEKYLTTILNDRLSEKLSKADDDEERARLITYREETIRADLAKGLRAQGYYEGSVDFIPDSASPMTGTYKVRTGPDYRISSIGIIPKSYAHAIEGLHEGDPLNAFAVLEAEARLYKNIQDNNCLLSLDVKNSVVLNTRRNTGAVTFNVTTGPHANFGPAIFKGQENIKSEYLQKLVPWKPGDCYRRDKIETFRSKLMGTGLFAHADTEIPAKPDKNGQAPITVTVKERAPRSLSAGLSYYTDEGPGAKFGWEHRNLLGSAEKLRAALTITRLKQDIATDLGKPFFLRDDQSLSLNASLGREDSDAYDERALKLGGKISRDLTPRLSGLIGSDYQLTQTRENGVKRLYGLVSVPVSLAYDSRNDKLNAYRGWLLTATATPFFDVLGESDPFFKVQAGARTYISLNKANNTVLALRATAGSVLGEGTFSLPASQRFYAGGSDTVRGFGYQEVGPVNAKGDPTGGRSALTGSAELRFPVSGDLGGVIFTDAGNVSQQTSFDTKDFWIGAGAGIRYYTDFGPLRFDVAVPVNNKDKTRSYHLYVSIGQAF